MKKRIVNAALESRVNAVVRRRAENSAFARHLAPENSEKKRWYNFVNKDDEADLYIYDEISAWWGIGANDFVNDLAEVDAKVLNLYLNSPGGSVFEGFAIYAALVRHAEKKNCKINVVVDGWAASIASVIAMAGDTITIGAHASFMVHKPWSWAIGDADNFRDEADVLDDLEGAIIDIYEARTGGNRAEITEWVAAETWFKGQAAVDAGFADAVVDLKKKKTDDAEDRASKPAASADGEYFKAIFPNMPDDVREALTKQPANDAGDKELPKTKREFKAFLRDQGFSGKQADAIAGQGFRDGSELRDEAVVEENPTTTDRRDDAEKRDEAVSAIKRAAIAAAIRAAAQK